MRIVVITRTRLFAVLTTSTKHYIHIQEIKKEECVIPQKHQSLITKVFHTKKRNIHTIYNLTQCEEILKQ